MDIKKILISLLLLTSLSLYAGATDWQDLEIDNGLLFIEVEIGGVPTKAMLDTGAETLAVNIDFLEKNKIEYKKGRKITVQGAVGERKTRRIKDLKVNIFGAEIPIKGALPYSRDSDVAMIIGLPFFKNFIVQIDYPNKRMKLISRDSLDLKKIKNVKMQHGNNKSSLVVTTYLSNEKTINLLFDTGSNGGLLFERHFADRNGLLESSTNTKGNLRGVNDSVGTETFVLPALKIGPYNLRDVLVTVPQKGQSANFSEKEQVPELGSLISKGTAYNGILGYDILKHFVITLDAKTARMHIIAP